MLGWIAGLTLILSSGATVRAGEADMAAINGMDRVAFVQKFGGILENSPWVAEQAWDKVLLPMLVPCMRRWSKSRNLRRRRANWRCCKATPNLAGKEAQAGAMTASPVTEQVSAGLNALSKDEMTQISDLNAAYKTKFGFPFIIAVRMHTTEGIFFEFRRRLQNDTVPNTPTTCRTFMRSRGCGWQSC
jgi:2-oxo-4-hydroxy-4-carboxy-5-ureidoimidazoline decarboxylase